MSGSLNKVKYDAYVDTEEIIYVIDGGSIYEYVVSNSSCTSSSTNNGIDSVQTHITNANDKMVYVGSSPDPYDLTSSQSYDVYTSTDDVT